LQKLSYVGPDALYILNNIVDGFVGHGKTLFSHFSSKEFWSAWNFMYLKNTLSACGFPFSVDWDYRRGAVWRMKNDGYVEVCC
jgi:hypothetical protein